jgi:hypothetical protein
LIHLEEGPIAVVKSALSGLLQDLNGDQLICSQFWTLTLGTVWQAPATLFHKKSSLKFLLALFKAI